MVETEIPDKQYFRIGEVSRLTSLKSSVLRFWETEFAELSPPKSRTGQRLYTRRDIELLLEIKRLLYSERLTIEGARSRLADGNRNARGAEKAVPDEQRIRSLVGEIRKELEQLRDTLLR